MTRKEIKQSPKKAIPPKPEGKGDGVFRLILNLLGMLIWVAASVIVAQYLIGFLLVWTVGAEKLNQPVWTALYSALSYTIAVILIVFVPVLIRKRRKTGRLNEVNEEAKEGETLKNSLGLRGMPTWVDIGLVPVGFIAYLLVAAGLVALFSLFPWFNAEEVQEVGFSVYVAGFDRVVAFFTLVVVAPVAEELIFRGWLYDKMRTKLSEKVSEKLSIVISIFLVSLLFGIIHRQWNVGVNVFAMSVISCGLREITGTIYSGILLHMLKNGIAFYLLYVLGIG